jgi:hypothetical protein
MQRKRNDVLKQCLKMTAFWAISPCNFVEVDRHFRRAYCLHHQGDDEVRTSETSAYFHDTTRRYIQGNCYLHTCRRENLKSHTK